MIFLFLKSCHIHLKKIAVVTGRVLSELGQRKASVKVLFTTL